MTRAQPVSGFPRWVAPLMAVPPLFFGVVSVAGAGRGWWAVGLAVAFAITPWLVNAVRPGWLSTTAFTAGVVVPLAVLNTAGGAVGVDLSAEGHSQFTLMLLVWLVGEMACRARLAPMLLAGLATVGVVVGRTIAEPSFAHAWIYWLGGAGVAFLTGFLLRRQQLTLMELRDAQAALAGEAARRERQRIAREVHDVVAHTLTVTLMHVSAARRALERDPAGAGEALEEAELLGRRSLADIRRTVGLLRAEDEGPDRHALPDATDLPSLISSYEAAGTPVSVRTGGGLDDLPPAVGLTVYRLVQEALSNAAGHAPGAPVDLRLEVRRHEVRIEVSNPVGRDGAAPRAGGLGLVGMRERVALLGGRLDAGARDGTWTVRARLPLDSRAPAAGAPA
jgi:signal transduction histidine kinase